MRVLFKRAWWWAPGVVCQSRAAEASRRLGTVDFTRLRPEPENETSFLFDPINYLVYYRSAFVWRGTATTYLKPHTIQKNISASHTQNDSDPMTQRTKNVL